MYTQSMPKVADLQAHKASCCDTLFVDQLFSANCWSLPYQIIFPKVIFFVLLHVEGPNGPRSDHHLKERERKITVQFSKIADLQARIAAPGAALWACISAVFQQLKYNNNGQNG